MPAVIFATATLQPWQARLASGVIAGAGTDINLFNITGLRDLPAIRTNDGERGQADGLYPGTSYLGERVCQIVWELTLASNMEQALQDLASGYQNVRDPELVLMTGMDYLIQYAGVGNAGKAMSALQVQLPGRTFPFVMFGRPSKYSVPIDTNYQYGQVKVTTEWTSPDGLLYDGSVVAGTTGLPAPAQGLSWPASFPWTFGSSTGGFVTLDNTGAYDAYPLVVIRGPVSYPRVTNANTGEYMDYDIVLGAGDMLAIDHRNGVVTLNGTANRNDIVNVGSTFYTMAAGNTTLTFTSRDAVTVAGAMSAYLLPANSAA